VSGEGALAGGVALVSGAARGMGRSHAIRLAEAGADVIAIDSCADVASAPYPLASKADFEETVSAIEATGRRVVKALADVRDAEAIAAAVGEGVAALGRLDFVVANAGIVSYYAAEELSPQAWREMIDINLTGTWNLVSPSLRPMIEGGRGGAIVLVSSTAALIGLPHLAHYCAAKAGLVGLMQSLAVELGPHSIRVNTIHPTGVNTMMVQNEATYSLMSGGQTSEVEPNDPHPIVAATLAAQNSLPTMWVQPEDVSNAVLFLLGETGRYVTGTQLRVDAGSAVK
jgi:SDR family mycofactocin-dependent oxidoreductase